MRKNEGIRINFYILAHKNRRETLVRIIKNIYWYSRVIFIFFFSFCLLQIFSSFFLLFIHSIEFFFRRSSMFAYSLFSIARSFLSDFFLALISVFVRHFILVFFSPLLRANALFYSFYFFG